jgi:hypothetical protein
MTTVFPPSRRDTRTDGTWCRDGLQEEDRCASLGRAFALVPAVYKIKSTAGGDQPRVWVLGWCGCFEYRCTFQLSSLPTDHARPQPQRSPPRRFDGKFSARVRTPRKRRGTERGSAENVEDGNPSAWQLIQARHILEPIPVLWPSSAHYFGQYPVPWTKSSAGI